MKIDGDFLLKILSRPEWDEEVQEMLEFFEEDRVIVDPEFYRERRYIDKYHIELEFSLFAQSKKQRAEEEIGNTYFQKVSFRPNTTIELPFGLEKGDDSKTCIEKISKKVDNIRIFRAPVIDSLLIEINDTQYLFSMKYETEKRILKDLVVFTLDTEMNLNENYTPREISLKQALGVE